MDMEFAGASAFDEALDELLDDAEPEYASVEPWLRACKAALDAAPAGVELTARDVPHAAALPGDAADAVCKCEPPEAVALVGSVLLRTCVTPPSSGERPRADLAVVIPASCVLEKDYLDYRYHAKRALYLQYVADALAAAGILAEGVARAYLEPLAGDVHKPALVLAPVTGGGGAALGLADTEFEVRLIPTLAEGAFAPAKLAASRCNLRARRAAEDAGVTAGVTAGDAVARKAGLDYAGPREGGAPTPKYNHAIAEDVYSASSGAQLREAFAADARLGLATRALKLWMRRRGMLGGAHSLGGWELAALVAALGCGGELRAAASGARAAAQQVLAAVAARGALRSPRALAGGAASVPLGECPCLVEDTAAGVRVNLLARVRSDTLREFECEAARAVRALAARTPEALGALFAGAPARACERFDAVLSLDARAAAASTPASTLSSLETCAQRAAEERATDALVAALGARARRVRLLGADVPRADFAASAAAGKAKKAKKAKGGGGAAGSALTWRAPALVATGSAAVGVVLDKELCERIVDIGPPQSDKRACARFRALWGERSTLRRFRDGAVCEAAAWDDVARAQGRHAIASEAARTVLMRMLPDVPVSYAATELDTVSNSDSEALPALRAAFDALARRLRALPGLPLGVRAVAPVAASLRGAEPCVRGAHPVAAGAWADVDAREGNEAKAKKNKRKRSGASGGSDVLVDRCMDAHEVLVEVEGSGRWPNEPAALAATRGAYVLALGEQLRTAHGVTSNAVDDGASEAALEVFFEGFAFRLRVHDTRPKGDANASAQWHERERAREYASAFEAAADAAPALPGAVRLAKRWLGAHLFDPDAFGDEGVELVTLAAFGHMNGMDGAAAADSGAVPATALAGFARFLSLVGGFDWNGSPLFVAGMGDDSGVRQAAERAKASAKGARMVVASAVEPAGTSRARLRGTELARLCALARACGARLDALLTGGFGALRAGEALPGTQTERWLQLFRGSCAPFDCAVCCHTRACARATAMDAIDPALGEALEDEGALAAASAALMPLAKPAGVLGAKGPAKSLLVGFDPVAILARQVARMPGVAFVGWDRYGGRTIAVALKAAARGAGDALAEAIAAVGEGLVASVCVRADQREPEEPEEEAPKATGKGKGKKRARK